MMRVLRKLALGVLNRLQQSGRFDTAWVEDLPPQPCKNTIYIVGGRNHPFYAAVACPRKNCRRVITLEIAEECKPRWHMQEHPDGTVSLHPSIHVNRWQCKCHYWIKRGGVVWAELPSVFVPRENTIVDE